VLNPKYLSSKHVFSVCYTLFLSACVIVVLCMYLYHTIVIMPCFVSKIVNSCICMNRHREHVLKMLILAAMSTRYRLFLKYTNINKTIV